MSVRKPAAWQLLVVPLLLVLVGTALSIPSARAATSGYVGGSEFSTAACVPTSGILSSIKPSNVKVKMRSAWARSYKAQYVKVSAQLQARNPTAWVNLSTSGSLSAKTVLVSRSYVTRFYAVPPLTPLRVPAGLRDHYRVIMRLQWYSPKSGKVEGTVTKTVTAYRWGTATGVTCPAATAPQSVTGLAVTATGTSGQARASFAVGSAPLPQAAQCSPACGSVPVPAAGQAGLSATVAGLVDGVARSVLVRSCLVRHPTLCGAWVSDATTPFGPLAAPILAVNVNGQCLNWNVSGTAQGKSVTAVLRLDGTQIDSWSSSGGLARSGTQCVGYAQTRTFQVTFTDSGASVEQPLVRPARSVSLARTTAATPPPTVTTRRGAQCSGSQCPGGFCSSVCYYLLTTGHDFPATTTCRVFYQSGGVSQAVWSQGNTETPSAGNWMSPGLVYDVRCDNGASTGWKSH